MTLESVVVDTQHVHELSIGLIQLLGKLETSMVDGALASGLTLIRLHAGAMEREMEPEEEIDALRGLMLYMDGIFEPPAPGEAN